MRRMSLLDILEKCGGAGELSAKHGAGRPAAMSKAFHARQAGLAIARALMMALSPSEREEVLSWKPASDVEVEGCLLRYEDAMKEFEVGLDCFGEYTGDPDEAITFGHPDFAWIRNVNGHRIAFVADLKKSIWTSPEGPDSLQLHAYGRAVAKMYECVGYCVGIWAAEEGEWMWSMEVVMLDGPMGRALWARISFAASNSGEFAFGDHCSQCWSRKHCPEWMISPEAATTELAPFAVEGMAITADQANRLLLLAKRAKESAEYVKTEIEESIRRGELEVTDKDGKRYKPVRCKGKESVDAAKVRELHPELVKAGAPYERFMWLKAK